MHEDLIKRLRLCGQFRCRECEYEKVMGCRAKLNEEAADAIEELTSENESLAKSVNEASEILRRRWVPVTERLPEDNEAVNVVWVNHNPVFYYQHIKDKPQTSTGVYYRGQWYWWSAVAQDYLAEYGKWEPDLMDSAIEVTHWMPLPEPPKEG